jgi:hypothetical protein
MNVYLAKKDGRVIFHTNLTSMEQLDGISKPEKTVTVEEWEAADSTAHIDASGNIVLGITPEEKAAEEKRQQVANLKSELENIDRKSGASRQVRDLSVSAGVVLDAVRVLVPRLAEAQGIKLPEGFGANVKSAEDIPNLFPPPNATEKEKADFADFKALLILTHFDPAINPGLKIITEAEMQAIPLRKQLEELG